MSICKCARSGLVLNGNTFADDTAKVVAQGKFSIIAAWYVYTNDALKDDTAAAPDIERKRKKKDLEQRS